MFPQGTFKAGGASLTIASGNEKDVEKALCRHRDPQLAEDPRYSDNAGRREHRKDLRVNIEDVLYRRPAAEWISIINSAGVPCGPVLDLGQALAHPTTVGLGMVQNVKHPTLGDMKALDQAVRINGDDPDWLRRHPPFWASTPRRSCGSSATPPTTSRP